MKNTDNTPQDNAKMEGAATYIETVYGTRNFASALMLDDAQSIMDLMDDFSNHQTAPIHQRIAELEAENVLLRKYLEMGKNITHKDDKGEESSGYHVAYAVRFAAKEIERQLAEQALNHNLNLKDNE